MVRGASGKRNPDELILTRLRKDLKELLCPRFGIDVESSEIWDYGLNF